MSRHTTVQHQLEDVKRATEQTGDMSVLAMLILTYADLITDLIVAIGLLSDPRARAAPPSLSPQTDRRRRSADCALGRAYVLTLEHC